MWERCFEYYGWHDFVGVLKRADAERRSQVCPGGVDASSSRNTPRSRGDFPVFVMPLRMPAWGIVTMLSLGSRKLTRNGDWCIIFLKADHVWDPLRSDPRFSRSAAARGAAAIIRQPFE